MPTIICKLCKQPIKATSPDMQYCTTCEAILAYERKHMDDSPTTHDTLKSPFRELLDEIEQYNKANNVCLTYGKYVSLKKRGLI